QAREAVPGVARNRPARRSRRWLLVAAAAGVAGVGAVGWGVVNRLDTAEATLTGGSRAQESARQVRTLQFRLTGSTSLSTVTYTVNGEPTTVKDVKLPWRRDVPIPPLPDKTKWTFKCRFPPGDITFRVFIDGYMTQSGSAGASGTDGHFEAKN
ncbi:MAG TPA: hypothetical protein VE172_22205, partial [Stackebrandtia sp.]|uniref:hypothetical protein n=1 Tax=Stackebrandtia sp. TaxID=2023065 RepID=UPI002D34ADF3